MRKIFTITISILLVLIMLGSGIMASNISFTDISSSEYYYDAVLWAVENKITAGTSNTTFSPNETCTRGQTVTFLWRSAGEPEPTSKVNPFKDVKNTDYFYKAVLWAAENGITTGTSETTFSPEDTVSRAQFVTFLWRYAGQFKSSLYTIFDDSTDKEQYFYYPILWAYSWEITKGIEINLFGVDDPCTRGQTVTFLYRYYLSAHKQEEEKVEHPITSLTINGNDISDYVICYDSSSNGLMEFAATELQEYIETSTGIKLNVIKDNSSFAKRIYVKNNLVNDDTDGYKYYNDANGLVLEGSYERGALYSVYNFLEDELGWRFLTQDTEVQTKSGEIDLSNLNVSYKQFFALRTIFWSCYWDSTSQDISAKVMCNGGDHKQESYRGGSSVHFSLNGVHSIGYLSGTGDGVSANPCPNDETIYNTVYTNVMNMLSSNPNEIISVAQNDTWARCECSLCQADDLYYGSPAGSIIKFCNRLADEVNLTYPNAKIQTLAYAYSRQCPVNITVNDNVYVQLCSSDCCLNHPLRDTSCELNKSFATDLVEWGAICNHIQIWDYTIDFPVYLNVVPNLDLLLDNVRFFHENNAYAVFEQGNYNEDSPGFGELRAYLISKCFENPYMSDEEYYAYMDEFLKYYYGNGWKYIRQYIDTVQKMADDLNLHCKFACTPEDIYGSHGFRPYNELFIKLFDKAEELAQTETQLNHIRRTRISCDYLRIGAIYTDYAKAKTSDKTERKEYIYNQIESLYNDIKEFNITHLGENILMPEFTLLKQNPRTWGNYYGDMKYDENK